MKNYLILPALSVIFFVACKGEKDSETKDESPISALGIIKGQLNRLDTSLYAITKYETSDHTTDSVYLKREEIRKYVAPFLSLPEIADKNYYKNYTEEKIIDAQQQTLNITSTAKNEDAEIQRQILIIDMADISNGKVQSIFIDRYIPSADSTIEQKLFWEIDKSFSISNIVEKENQPEKTHYLRITWQ